MIFLLDFSKQKLWKVCLAKREAPKALSAPRGAQRRKGCNPWWCMHRKYMKTKKTSTFNSLITNVTIEIQKIPYLFILKYIWFQSLNLHKLFFNVSWTQIKRKKFSQKSHLYSKCVIYECFLIFLLFKKTFSHTSQKRGKHLQRLGSSWVYF